MNAIRKIISALGAVACCTAAGAQAAQAGGSAQPDPIPRASFIATMDTEFKQMDADKNGILTRQEIEGYQRATSILIAKQRNTALFEALDKDKNGSISPAEFTALPMNIPAPNPDAVLAQVDANHDGRATLIEYRAGKLLNFDRVDADKDGIVSVAEMKAAGLIK